MAEKIMDCKGLACPQPVLNAKKAIETEHPETLRILVDNEAAVQNVSRFVSSKGYTVDAKETGEKIWTLTAHRNDSSSDTEGCAECEVMTSQALEAIDQKVTVFIQRDTLGSGDDELGSKLMLNFLSTLPEFGDELWRVVLVNGGVKLTTEENPCCEKLKELEKMGAGILVCGTCLDHFGLLKQKAVGETTNMLDVVTSLQLASKVISV
ncbi:sulfurtransferase-like selenium metabolism protein YedF [Desulfobaculum bizertense]|uniref:Selenium metabolism protein YedF n=1 Tax=Desulfobaculum bizertense DSM 18034 TaxID=1121442 RepID=A0A1T4W1U3_9BACT|nr:sulfurtransferase-like selenium metabolism protein YedF [Desulfobaculum bizertense]UIJ38883.1 sulfurtransferase-like selenium metabolism protein YedF [Desulfobaculum bizertense]SKA71222.1 selenium metabolism protein YedF [Desulfobaculum bizertense DSM 18034]